jgi:hypothetical protein
VSVRRKNRDQQRVSGIAEGELEATFIPEKTSIREGLLQANRFNRTRTGSLE